MNDHDRIRRLEVAVKILDKALENEVSDYLDLEKRVYALEEKLVYKPLRIAKLRKALNE